MPGLELFANQATTTVSSGGTTAPSAGASESWTVASSSGFPAASSTSYPPTFFRVTDTALSSEKMIVTNVSGTTWTVTRGAEGTTPVSHSSGFTVQNVVTAAALEEFVQFGMTTDLFADVTAYGAVGDGTTDNTSAFAAAIAAVTPSDQVFATAGLVFVPAGTFLTGPIVLPQRVGLMGVGMASTVKLKAGAAANSVLVSNYPNAGATGNGAQGCMVRNIRLDGNQSARSGNWDSLLVFTNTYSPTGTFEYSDARHTISGVMAQYATGDGIVATDSIISDCYVWSCNGFGFVTNNDTHVSNCDAGNCGIDGFWIGGSSALNNCKAWFCGAALTSNRYSGSAGSATTVASPANSWDGGSGITYSLANGYGNGFLVGGSGNYATLNGCYAQDNARSGFYVTQNYAVLSGCAADSNGNNGTSTGVSTGTPVGSFAGFDVTAAGSRIDGISFDRGANLNHQAAGLHIHSGTGGRISLGFGGALNDGSNMPPLISGDSPQGLDLAFYNMTTAAGTASGGGYVTDASFASGTYTVDPYEAQTWDLTLVGNITLGNPALTGTNTTGSFLFKGQRLRYVIRQGSTVYTVAWGSAFSLRTVPSSAPNSVSVLDFTYDGTSWQQQSSGGEVTVQVLGTTFNSGTGTTAQTVTGMSVNLQPGKYLLKARIWYTAHGTTGSTQTFNWTFGGTATSAQVAWQYKTAAYTAPVPGTTLTTSSGASPTLTTTTYPLDWEAHAVISAAGTLQLTCTSTTSGDEVAVLAGSYVTAEVVPA